ncbi:hypothetical protein CsSME_00017013 [Camellia sinensis var. sinensis]
MSLWSLLEKYSCKASKLHLKPRRFKIFIETLEHQLLKDRKKSKRKRPFQGENCSPTIPTTVSNQSRSSGNDTHAVKLVMFDSQNIQKLGPGKGSSVRRNVNVGINRSNCKADSFPVKTVRVSIFMELPCHKYYIFLITQTSPELSAGTLLTVLVATSKSDLHTFE